METKSPDQQNSTDSPKWLERLQHQAWEIELLISSGAIFSLIQLTNSIHYIFTGNFILFSSFLPTVWAISLRAITAGFILNLILRALWAATAMLNRLYPSGIDISQLHLNEPYLSYSKKFNAVALAIKLDRNATLVFIWSIVFPALLFGLLIPPTIIFAFFGFGDGANLLIQLTLALLLVSFLLFMYLDLFTTGWLRRGGIIPKLYLPVYIFWNTITLGFIWRPVVQTIFTNFKNKWKVFVVLFIGYILLVTTADPHLSFYQIIAAKNNLAETKTIHSFYGDQLSQDEWTETPYIQSQQIKEDYLRIFIPFKEEYTRFQSINQFSDLLSVSVNDSTCSNIRWIEFIPGNGQQGVITYLPIKSIKSGLQKIDIHIGGDNFGAEKFTIPFWRE